MSELEDVKTGEGAASIKMSCTFCKPNAKLSWLKNKMEIFHGYKYHFENNDKDYSLVIMNVKPEDAGKYSCLCNDCKTAAWLYVEGKVSLDLCYCYLWFLLFLLLILVMSNKK